VLAAHFDSEDGGAFEKPHACTGTKVIGRIWTIEFHLSWFTIGTHDLATATPHPDPT
jgi:hypothetical protein